MSENIKESSFVSHLTELRTRLVRSLIFIFVIIYFVGRIDMPAPNKLIKKEIPNEELTTLK